MSLFGKHFTCDETCKTCEKSCALHRRHLGDCYCESIECALARIKMICSKPCECDDACIKERGHDGQCFCGNMDHLWRGTDFPVAEMKRESKYCNCEYILALAAADAAVGGPPPSCPEHGHNYQRKEDSMFTPEGYPRSVELAKAATKIIEERQEAVENVQSYLCDHANETPVKTCVCHWDCTCRETMCEIEESFDPLYQIDRTQKCGEETPNGPCQDFLGHQWVKTRPNWHETWMEIAHAVGRRSYDPRLKVGAIIVAEDNTTMLSLGYNGNGTGLPNVPESTEPGQSGFIHAEVNALIKCPYHYPLPKVMYVTDSPCKQCAKCILNAKIKTVIYDREYRDTTGVETLRQAGVIVHKLSDLLQPK